MLPLPKPSEILALDLLDPEDLGIEAIQEVDGRLVYDVDAKANFVTVKRDEAAARLFALVPSEVSETRWRLGVSYWALAEIYMALARQAGRSIGQVSDRTGQVTVSAGQAEANRASAEEMIDKLEDLYPEVVFPDIGDNEGGAIRWSRW